MMAILGFLISKPIILAIGAGIIGMAGAWMHGRITGAQAEKLNQIAANAKAATEGQQIDDAIRQPTEAMARAGLRENTIQGAAIWATPAWQAMVDMALVP